MRAEEVFARSDEILLARKLAAYMGVEDEPRRMTADERARQYGDMDADEAQLAEALDRLTGVEHEPRRPLGARDYAGLRGVEAVLAMEYDEWLGKPEVTR